MNDYYHYLTLNCSFDVQHSNINSWKAVIIILLEAYFDVHSTDSKRRELTLFRFESCVRNTHNMNAWMTVIMIRKPCAFNVHTIVISMHEWLLPLFDFKLYAFDVHTTVISMHEWSLSLFHSEQYAIDVHTTVISMHEWGLLPLFRFESYAFDVHTTVIWMNEWRLSSFRFKPCALNVHTIVILMMNGRYHYSSLNHTHLSYTAQWYYDIIFILFESYARWHTTVISSINARYHIPRFKACIFDVYVMVISIHELPLSLFRFESYAFDVHTTVISIMNDRYQPVPAEILWYHYNEAEGNTFKFDDVESLVFPVITI